MTQLLSMDCYIKSFNNIGTIFLGMLLRLFMYMYDMEVIEEESFLRWKEEVNDEYPGKGKSLFQVKFYSSYKFLLIGI